MNHVGLPLWLPGECSGTTPVLLRQARTKPEPPAMEAPPTKEEYASAFGPINAVRVPHAIHDTMVKAQLDHLGDYIREDGSLRLTRQMLKAYIPDRAVDFFVKWFKRYRDDLRD